MSTKTWFDKAHFGMFTNWVHCNQFAWELSWLLVGSVFSLPYCKNIPVDKALSFNP